ncbi:prominin family protein [Clostridium algidicarnis]|nr:prominin family protein [Clostridium algidicarnis]MBU3208831.1 prominin family protein [Clostridium algidicarnis]MBU3226658.1 prominin family protein [Clostridium algidicarnis]MBU3250431.1 prominin family protein [Clostridium algidicarnis]
MLFGIGVGILIGVIFMFSYKVENSMTREKIEEKARIYGMDYPEEFKVINKKEVE